MLREIERERERFGGLCFFSPSVLVLSERRESKGEKGGRETKRTKKKTKGSEPDKKPNEEEQSKSVLSKSKRLSRSYSASVDSTINAALRNPLDLILSIFGRKWRNEARQRRESQASTMASRRHDARRGRRRRFSPLPKTTTSSRWQRRRRCHLLLLPQRPRTLLPFLPRLSLLVLPGAASPRPPRPARGETPSSSPRARRRQSSRAFLPNLLLAAKGAIAAAEAAAEAPSSPPSLLPPRPWQELRKENEISKKKATPARAILRTKKKITWKVNLKKEEVNAERKTYRRPISRLIAIARE